MTESSQRANHSARRGTEDVVDGVGEVVNATLELVGDLARRSAEATVPPDRAVPEPGPDATPINVALHFGAATATNLLQLAGSVVRDAATMTGTGASRARSTAAVRTPASARPVVKAGGTLRIPLSIENPDDKPMEKLGFATQAISRNGVATDALGKDCVRFEPVELTIAPHDFEKLTVLVDTTAGTETGSYEAVIGLVGTPHEITVRFDVT